MPGKVKVKILAGRNLPVMDRSSDTTDAYVEVKLGSITQKTDVYRKSLNPQWNSEWFIFEVDDAELQDEPLHIRLMDYDTYSANDAIGKVYLDLNPLLIPPGLIGRGNIWLEKTVPPSGGVVLSGWLPVYDTMHGTRGEVSVIVKVELFSDVNKFRQSSCGVQFFSTPASPCGFKIQTIHGFVKELVVNDDPEYQWIDKIRTPRASNEARQTLFSQLSGEVRRKIGLKVLELGGNAVVGYQQMFDLEGETGLVVRGIGTAVTLVRSLSEGISVTPLSKEQHGGRDDGQRLHEKESVLNLKPCAALSSGRLCSMHVDHAYKQPMKRNSSSSNTHECLSTSIRDQESNEELLVKSKIHNSLTVPNFENVNPRIRVRNRSRSAPFNEMSPIQETVRETLSDSLDSLVPSLILACQSKDRPNNQSVTITSPECSVVDIRHSLRMTLSGNESETDEADEKCDTVSFVEYSGDSCGSGDSDSSVCDAFTLAKVDSNLELSHAASDYSLDSNNKRAIFNVCVPTLVIEKESDVMLNAALPSLPNPPVSPFPNRSPRCVVSAEINKQMTANSPTPVQPSPSRPSPCRRRSSDSEISLTPKGTSLSDSVGSSGCGTAANRIALRQSSVPVSIPSAFQSGSEAANLEVLEYPFLTMKTYPPGFILHLGGTVSARSVKLLDRINNSEEPETRDNWWTEIRMEVRSHARALGCNVILGYEEHTSIYEEVCVISAAGTAAIVNLQPVETEASAKDVRESKKADFAKATPMGTAHGDDSKGIFQCRVCHIPYSKANIPFPMKLSRCAVCRKGKVPDVLIATIEPPFGVAITGRGCLIQARLCRVKRDESRGDQQAKEVSDGLPFLEYELHRQLINKLRIKGMNSIFGLKVQVSVGERHMVGIATGTAVFLSALPLISLPTVGTTHLASKQSKLMHIQKILSEAHATNKDFYGVKQTSKAGESECNKWSDSEDSDDETNDLDLSAENKDTCVLEIDDAEDVDVIELLIDPLPLEGFDVVTTETVPGLPENMRRHHIQAFTRVWKGKIPPGQPARQFNRCFEMILRSIYFKMRKIRPCTISNLQFYIDLPEEDEIQITVLGTASAGSSKCLLDSVNAVGRNLVKGSSESEMIFHLEEDGHSACAGEPANHVNLSSVASRSTVHHSISAKNVTDKTKFCKERQPVNITTLIQLPGCRVERYLGHLNFFFIRESTSIREDGGLSGFMQSFIAEVLGIVRAHVSALGGNAMVAFFMTQCVLLHNPHKNQGQCLINVGGDVVQSVRCTERELAV